MKTRTQPRPRHGRQETPNALRLRGKVVRVWPIQDTASNGRCMQFQPILFKYRAVNGRENEAFITLAASLVGMVNLGDELTVNFTIQAKPRAKDDFFHISLFAHSIFHHVDQQEYFR